MGTLTTAPAKAAIRGIVSETGYNSTNGNYVYIKHTIEENGVVVGELSTRYLHLKSITVDEGEFVGTGDVIGIVGATGSANGDLHLHFTITKKIGNYHYALNPLPYYHGSDDRGFSESDQVIMKGNNPMYLIQNQKWIPNPVWDSEYSDFVNTSSTFYTRYMNAIRNGVVIAIARYSS